MPDVPPLLSASPPRRRTLGWWGLAALGALGVAAVLYWFPPDKTPLYPRCMFHAMTGLDCPGCGGLRATHQLLHGHVRAAFALNPLLVLILPLTGWFALAGLLQATTGRTLPHPFKHRAWVWALLALVVVSGVARNLPVGPLAALRWP